MIRRLVLLLALTLTLTACSGEPSGDPPAASAPSPANPDDDPGNHDQVGVIGDSLTAEMIDHGQLEPALIELGWAADDIRLDGVWGRPIDGSGGGSTTGVIEDWRQDGFDPRVWLIALGTNNSADGEQSWQYDVRAVINEINSGAAGNYTIYWVTTGYQEPDQNHQEAFLDTVQDIASEYPNVQVADYGAYLDEHRDDPEWDSYWSDSVHHSESGYETLRTPFYAEVLEPEAPA